ncbi:MAG TPA: cache domain-containing protein, partial [Kofleriaceae bacterium]|nr:cache domain-containing protein [Kofleriaceae bacterium]
MFWSKIWFFLLAVAAAIALTFALVLPRPAARAMVTEEHRRLTVACGVIGILLADDARKRVDLAGSFARTEEIVKALESASAAPTLDEARMKQVRATAETVMKGITGDRKPDFAMLIDKKGRVVARVRLDENVFGDLAAGRPLVDDALAGYLRDDLWAANGTVYFVSASPVVKFPDYVGAVVLGHQVTNDLAQKLVGSLGVDVGFYVGDNTVATSKTIALDQATLGRESGKLSGGDLARDCQANQPFPLRAGNEELTGIVARLPGEASARRAFYTIFINRPVEHGFLATLKAVRQGDLSFGSFPWVFVAGAFLLVLGAGITFMLLESDRPLRRLAAESVRLAKGEVEKLSEDAHPGKFGSIARSVNIHLDKIGREASKSSKKDIEQLLGPAPEGSLGTIDLLATALPAIRPGGSAPATPPPPSDFKFGESGSRPAMPAMPASSSSPAIPTPPARPGTPPPAPPRTPPMGVRQVSPGMTPPVGVRQTSPGMTPPAG